VKKKQVKAIQSVTKQKGCGKGRKTEQIVIFTVLGYYDFQNTRLYFLAKLPSLLGQYIDRY